MATFTPLTSSTPVDTRLLVPWVNGLSIFEIDASLVTSAIITSMGSPSLVVTYNGSGLTESPSNVPTGGTFTEVVVTGMGTLSGISPAASFTDILTNNAYRIFDGTDTINGSTLAGDFLFAGYSGNDTLDGWGGGDFFVVSERVGIPTLVIKGESGFTDTLFVTPNILDANAFVLDLRGSTLTSINAITLSPGTGATIKSSQYGAGLSATAVIGAFSGTGAFDIVKDTNGGALDLSLLSVSANTTFKVSGTGSAETITGTNSADQFIGGGGADVLNGGFGDDIFYLFGSDGEFATFNGGPGTDRITTQGTATLNGFNASSSSIEMVDAFFGGFEGNAGANTFDFRGLTSVNGTLVVKGVGGADSLYGSGFDDSLGGGEGNDLLSGENGADLIAGDAGKDTMTGGAAADNFFYWATADSQRSKSLRDVITDFQPGVDTIDVSFIDPDSGKPADQKFKFTKKEGAAFKGKVGQIIFDQIDKKGSAKDMTVIYGDADGNGVADFAVQLTGIVNLTKGDFLL